MFSSSLKTISYFQEFLSQRPRTQNVSRFWINAPLHAKLSPRYSTIRRPLQIIQTLR
ncbi:hypothetical protein AXX17_AT5G52360 [Arabidopsis thaliana]|uniref:Uncharacterized protein n=1 Tax=Arabidopsis thaliana TaxID=3702 RepID=A0A178UB09_ARATH|nr:hypothetical protein AXX17_AT5G52360 [Arabidopsis thaliana]